MTQGPARVLIVALAANLGIAVAKFVAAGFTGSSAMLTEGIHSLVDSANQLLLMYGQKRAARPPDALHPGGYGRELYFWSFVVALMVFALGAGVSVYEGIAHIRRPEPPTSPLVAFAVLALAFLLEGGSTLAAFREVSRSRRGRSWWQTLIASKDPSTLIVLLENGAAMAGIVIAAVGLSLTLWTGNPTFDGGASVLIGLLLGFIAAFLAREAKGLLIGEAADAELIENVRRHISRPGIMGIGEIMTLHNAPDQIVVAANVDFDNRLTAGDVERIVSAIEASLHSRFPSIHRVYIRPYEDAGLDFGSGRGIVENDGWRPPGRAPAA